MDFLGRIHEPLMSRVRRFLPISVALISAPLSCLAVQFLRNLVIGFLPGLPRW